MQTLRNRRGLTLPEVIISLSIFAGIMAVTLNSMAASQNYGVVGRIQDDMVIESDLIADAVAQDLAASGWYFENNPLDTTTTPPTSLTYSSSSKTTDRNLLRYYPYVEIQNAGGAHDAMGARMAHTARAASQVRLIHPPEWDQYLPGTPADLDRDFDESNAAERLEWRDSFYARSQELVFVKATVSAWDHTRDRMMPNQEAPPALYFGGTTRDWRVRETDPVVEEDKRRRLRILYSSGWSPQYAGTDIVGFQPRSVYSYVDNPDGSLIVGSNSSNIPYGVVMESGYFPDLSDLTVIKPNWQTLDGTAFKTTQQLDLDNLREYSYAVLPSSIGAGCLVRLHRENGVTATTSRFPQVGMAVSASGGSGLVVDRVLSDHVARVVFDTFRTVDEGATTVTSLAINNVRVRIFFVQPGPTGALISRVVERIVTMRAQNSSRDKDVDEADSNASKLGDHPIGIDY